MMPQSTVRLQLHERFTFSDAAGHLPYYSGLGVSHLYLSPITCARRGSTHGYDVIDYGEIDPRLGGESAFVELAQRARDHGLGLLIDIVPNHMAAHPDNPWWYSVLQDGPSSPFAQWFDIQWDTATPGLKDKILLPILPDPLGVVLERGDIRIIRDASTCVLDVHGVRLPLAAGSLGLPEHVRDADGQDDCWTDIYNPCNRQGRQALYGLLQRQHYCLAWWQCAADQINWRRFFEISDLVCVCVERDDVFNAVHGLPLRLFEQGLIDGLRIDHVDGLAQPLTYCARLYQALHERVPERPAGYQNIRPWLIVEKILAPDESLDQRWVVDGTTGYDFMNAVGAVLHDPAANVPLTRYWNTIVRDERPVEDWLREARMQMVQRHFCAERDALLDTLAQLVGMHPLMRDVTRPGLGRALDQLLIAFPVYRSYVTLGQHCATDSASLDRAYDSAHWHLLRDPPGLHALNFIVRSLKGRCTPVYAVTDPVVQSGGERSLQADVLRRFQQLTPPLAAKALEDTVFYRYGRLLSRNEVGADPGQFSQSVAKFHHWCGQRAQTAPATMNATATHDHKRGEDVRARLAVLTEIPYAWQDLSTRCLAALGQHKTIDCGAQAAQCYMLLQTIVGIWPPVLQRDDEAGMSLLIERLQRWQLKALREAKQTTSWFVPDDISEQEQADRIEFLLCDAQSESCRALAEFAGRIAPAGALNSLGVTVLRCTLPGIPDLYQGTDLWDFSLVDPDNRQDVDLDKRASRLHKWHDSSASDTAGMWSELLSHWHDGAIKQAVLERCLTLRRQHAGLFADGSYEPLTIEGPLAGHVMAFMRRTVDISLIVVVSRLGCRAVQRTGQQALVLPLIPPECWQETRLVLPVAGRHRNWHDTFSGKVHQANRGSLQVGAVLTRLPVSVLITP